MITDKILKSYEYNKISWKQDKKTEKFLNTKTIFNHVTGEIKDIHFNKEWHLRQSYLYNTFRIDYLNQHCIQDGFVPIFITLTLPSKFHPSSEYYQGLTVTDGYEELKKMFRSLYHDFKVNRKRVKLHFVRVIEPHKSFIPHLHAIIYVPKDNVEKFYNHYSNIKKLYELKQTDIKTLDTAKYAVVYLLKYIDKTLSGDDVTRGWRIHHKISRVLTMSNLNNGMTIQIFRVASNYLKYDKRDSRCYFDQILDKIEIRKIVVNEDDSLYSEKVFSCSNPEYIFYTKVMKYRDLHPSTYDEEINLLEEEIYEDFYKYRLLDLVVIDNDFNELFNLRDTEMKDKNFVRVPDIPTNIILEEQINNYIHVSYYRKD